MIEFLIDNIFVESGGVIFQQVIGIPMGTYCAPLLADRFLYARHLTDVLCYGAVRLSVRPYVRTSVRPSVRT